MPSFWIKIFNKVRIKIKKKKGRKKRRRKRSWDITEFLRNGFFFIIIKVYKKYQKEIKEDNSFWRNLNYGNLYSILSVLSEEKNFLPDILRGRKEL